MRPGPRAAAQRLPRRLALRALPARGLGRAFGCGGNGERRAGGSGSRGRARAPPVRHAPGSGQRYVTAFAAERLHMASEKRAGAHRPSEEPGALPPRTSALPLGCCARRLKASGACPWGAPSPSGVLTGAACAWAWPG